MISPAVMAGTVNAAIAGVKRMAPFAGRRGRAAFFAAAEQPVAARIGITWDEVVLVPIPGATAAVGGGDDRAVVLPKQASLGCRRESEQDGYHEPRE